MTTPPASRGRVRGPRTTYRGRARATRPLEGAPRLLRLALRRDRVVLPVWCVVIGGLMVASVASVVGLYQTEADRLAYARLAAQSAVARACGR